MTPLTANCSVPPDPVSLPKISSWVAQMQRWATLYRDARPLEAARRVRRRIVQIAGGARSRDGISPPATACVEAVRASQAQVTHSRSADLRLAVPAVPVAARSCGHLPARDAGTLASEWLPPVLALEVRSPRRPAGDPGRDPQSGPGRQPRQPALGCATHSWRVDETRCRHRPINRRQVHASASPPAFSGLAGLPAQSHCPHRSH